MMRYAPVILLVLAVSAACSSKDSARSDSASATTAGTASTSTSLPANSDPEPTANDVSNYKLDMDKMRKYAAAIKSFTMLSRTDSAAAASMGSSSANESTAQMIARLESNPVAMRELRKAGLSAKDYVWITAAYLQAAMTTGIMESTPGAKLPEGQNPANMEFLKANKAELERIMQEAGMMGS